MKLHRIVPASALALALLSGCNTKTEPTTTEAPASSTEAQSSPTTAPATAAVAEPYRVITDNSGDSKVEFTLTINGATVGSYNTDKVENDISSYLKPGQNTVKVAWTADSSMNMAEKARLKIQTQRGDNWNDIVTREVDKDTPAGDSEINIQVGPIDPALAPVASQPAVETAPQSSPAQPLTAPTTETPVEQAPVTPANTANLSEKYIIKSEFNAFSPGNFDVKVNGNPVGSYSTNSNQDITRYINKGRNRVEVSWKGTNKNQFSKSTLTLGVNRDDKWSTVGNASIDADSLKGTKAFDFMAQ